MNQSGRMENVRVALRLLQESGYANSRAALAEVEEWETRLAALADQMSTVAHLNDLLTAEKAEADRLKAALEQIQRGNSSTWIRDIVEAALAPADRNTA